MVLCKEYFLPIFFYLNFLIYGLLIESKSIIHVLIDLKVVSLFFFGIIFYYTCKEYLSGFFESKLWKRLLIINLVIDSFLFFLNYQYGLSYLISNDKFYLVNDVARYSDLSLPFLIVFMIYKISFKRNISWVEFLSVVLPIFYSGNRTTLIILFVIAILYLWRLGLMKFLKYGMVFSIIILFTSLLFVFSTDQNIIGRFKTLFDKEVVVKKLSSRFEPVFLEFNDWDKSYYWVFGKGFGKSIYIPWFSYRDNINDYNAYVDNLYFTLFIKFGLSSILIYFYLINYYKFLFQRRSLCNLLLLYFSIIGLTTAFIYQSSFWSFY